MAFNYCANQYESPYRPKLLSNWEIPKNYFHYRPQQRKGATRILTNDRGHLLTNVKSQPSPWDRHLGTCYMPNKIDVANQSSKIVDNERRIREGIYELKKKEYIEDEIRANIIPVETLPQDNQQNKLIYTPGDLLEEKQRFSTQFDAKLPEKSLINQNTNTMQQFDNDNELPKPILDTIYNFNLAKRLHRENLEHDPLPDTITETILKKLELDEHNHIESNCGPTGIGWKGYPGYGPMKCTKLKVYRPKPAIPNHNETNQTNNSVTSFEKKWRFLRRHKVEPIELAICWDLYPENSDDEPKPSKHIDGSNGSQAPAVFSLVKQSNNTRNSCENINNNNSERIFERIDNQLGTDRGFVLERPKTSAPIQRPVFEKYEEKNRFFERLKFNKKRSKSAHDLNSKQATVKENFNKSTPNLHHTCCCCCSCCYCYSNNLRFHQDKCKSKRSCMACAMKNVNINNNDYNNNNNKREFKMAFKAGIPQKCRVSNNNNNYKIRFNYKAPKQRNPFSPRRYTNNSLAPPFSLQKDKSFEYPEYWRLATVYQQSYKPMQYRKRPLMATIFK